MWDGYTEIQNCASSQCHSRTTPPGSFGINEAQQEEYIRYYKNAYHDLCIECHKDLKTKQAPPSEEDKEVANGGKGKDRADTLLRMPSESVGIDGIGAASEDMRIKQVHLFSQIGGKALNKKNKPTILIVDDEDDVLTTLKTFLTREGFDVDDRIGRPFGNRPFFIPLRGSCDNRRSHAEYGRPRLDTSHQGDGRRGRGDCPYSLCIHGECHIGNARLWGLRVPAETDPRFECVWSIPSKKP